MQDLKLEVVVVPVSDVDRAKRFYEGLGWRMDADLLGGDGLLDSGVDVGGVFHFTPERKGPVPGPDTEGRSYRTFASFSDPDGNAWLLQEIKTRLPGRGLGRDVATLTELLQEAEKRHGAYEASAPKHHWSGWYAAYIVAREQGKGPEEAAKQAAAHMDAHR